MDEDRSNAQVLGSAQQLIADLGMLVRHELDEAKEELAEKIKSAGLGAGFISASAFAGVMAIVCVTLFIGVLLSYVMPMWAAVLIVTVAWAVAALVLGLIGKEKVEAARPFYPEQTIDNIKEDFASARKRSRRSAGDS
jgi:Flp pilus assembly protein TadB